jgi:hypothetical protein
VDAYPIGCSVFLLFCFIYSTSHFSLCVAALENTLNSPYCYAISLQCLSIYRCLVFASRECDSQSSPINDHALDSGLFRAIAASTIKKTTTIGCEECINGHFYPSYSIFGSRVTFLFSDHFQPRLGMSTESQSESRILYKRLAALPMLLSINRI